VVEVLISEARQVVSPSPRVNGRIAPPARACSGSAVQAPALRSANSDSNSGALERALGVLREGLDGWDNFPDPKGAQVTVEKDALGCISDECLVRIEIEDRIELGGAIENDVDSDPDTVG